MTLPTFKRAFLLLLLALTGLAAILIAMAVLRAGRTPAALTWAIRGSLAHGLLVLASFAAFAALDRPRIRVLALGGMLFAAAMLALVPWLSWWEIMGPHRKSTDLLALDPILQAGISGFLTALLLCIVPFVLAPQMQRVGRIVQLTTVLYLSVAYVAILLWLWHIDTHRIEEVVATLLIPAGACMLGVFSLNKFLGVRRPVPLVSVPPTLRIQCPRCQTHQTLALGDSRCGCCRLKFTIAVEEPVCPNCQFNLHALTRPQCPECGHHLNDDEIPKPEEVSGSIQGI